MSFIYADCASCYDIALSTAMNCKGYADIVTCIRDTLGESDPCNDCICEVIDDIGEVFGHDWHCWKYLKKLKYVVEKLDKNKRKF